jgi:2-polyprenyl-3-methyl-5-hydroxy-6-metoxy-1,4-benzoquinol methylase
MNKDPSKTVEPQYQEILERQKEKGLARFGLMSSQVYFDDPKRLAFLLSRYKFVSKMLEGKSRVLEIGCADAFGTPIVAKAVKQLVAIDMDPLFIADARKRTDSALGIEFRTHDMLSGPINQISLFSAAYACDVLEHIPPKDEDLFLRNVTASLRPDGVAIFGMPSIESQVYASKQSIEGHVNCKTGEELRDTLRCHFTNVFLFSMNDEVVHTGFSSMAHYLFGLCCGVIDARPV